jgi:hypothetical protein
MDYLLVSGILLAGCAIGALLTAAMYLTQLKKIKTDVHRGSDADSQNPSLIPSDPDNSEPEERSA